MSECRLFFFIDALGAAVMRGQSAITDLGPVQAVRSVLGYSSACVPSILTGRFPEEHLHWSFFTRARPGSSEPGLTGLKVPAWLRAIPPLLRDRGRVRARLSPFIARANHISGYFSVYQMPLHELHRYGHCEPRDIFTPGGINVGTGIADVATAARNAAGTSHHISDVNAPLPERWAAATRAAAHPDLRFLLIYDGSLDGWLHDHTREHPGLPATLSALRQRIDAVRHAAEQTHGSVRTAIFSDHGMCTVRRSIDVFPALARSGLCMHRDYQCVIDSTMVRLWFPDAATGDRLAGCLDGITGLRRLSADELARERLRFPDDRFGQAFFLCDPGTIIAPSHMGRSPLAGMHGYTPDHEDSDAGFVSDDPSAKPQVITDFYRLMADAAA